MGMGPTLIDLPPRYINIDIQNKLTLSCLVYNSRTTNTAPVINTFNIRDGNRIQV